VSSPAPAVKESPRKQMRMSGHVGEDEHDLRSDEGRKANETARDRPDTCSDLL